MAARASSPWGVPAPAPPPAGPAHDLPDLLGPTERRLLDRGKKEHRETTETARRALQARRAPAAPPPRHRPPAPPRRHSARRPAHDSDLIAPVLSHTQVAEQTAEIGRCTVFEVHRQGLALTRTEDAVWALEQDVREASRLVKFLRRWYCFQILCCCDCCDPDAATDRTRGRRVAE
jgi:hypothetical protein